MSASVLSPPANIVTIEGESGRDTLYRSFQLPADVRGVRLFEVQAPPILEGDTAQIRGSFKVIDLASPHLPHFAALSYVWGKPDGKVYAVCCNGIDLEVLPNSHSALQHLRRKFGAFTISIDALCIDPSNEREKETQITHMGVNLLAGKCRLHLARGSQSRKFASHGGFTKPTVLRIFLSQARL